MRKGSLAIFIIVSVILASVSPITAGQEIGSEIGLTIGSGCELALDNGIGGKRTTVTNTLNLQGATTSDLKTIPFNETNTHEDDELPPPPPEWPQPELFDCPAISNGRLEDITFPSDADCQEYIYQGTLTIGSGVTMEDGAKVTIKATKVNIESSFHAENGAVVKIITQP